jgi:hypothetical protein
MLRRGVLFWAPTAEDGTFEEEAGVNPARSRHCDHRSSSFGKIDGSQELLPSSPARGEDPRKKCAVILLLPTSDTDLLSARPVRGVVPCCNTRLARPLVEDLPALVEAADLAVLRLLGGGRACDGSPDAPSVASCSGFGEIAASTCTAIARERGDP